MSKKMEMRAFARKNRGIFTATELAAALGWTKPHATKASICHNTKAVLRVARSIGASVVRDNACFNARGATPVYSIILPKQ